MLVSHLAADRRGGALEVPKDRFLEYTSEVIASQLRSLSTEARQCLKSWPCILMQEGRGQELAFLGQVDVLGATESEIKIHFASLPTESDLINDTLWRLRVDLDIEQFEFSRNHWAIKDRNLFRVLETAGHTIGSSVSRRFEEKALPAPSRSELISARDLISQWSHTRIDDLLLEAGVAELQAGRDLGSRRDRANAIVNFAIDNPGAATAENSLLAAFVVKAASLLSGQTGLSNAESVAVADSWPVGGSRTRQSGKAPNRVFVVHGRDEPARERMVAFLGRIGLDAIVLHEQPNMGRHLLTKFIDEADLVTFAIVLMTDDDVGGLKGGDIAPRARQNVILELGYFLAHLGQARVCALVTPGLETPSDFDGIVYIQMDAVGKWEEALRRELVAAGMPLSEESDTLEPPDEPQRRTAPTRRR